MNSPTRIPTINEKSKKSQQIGAELVVRTLEMQGVTHIFGIPGAKIDAVFNALVDSKIDTLPQQGASVQKAIACDPVNVAQLDILREAKNNSSVRRNNGS